ncbi:hypothetical protein ACLI4U_03460 [Natrialbaceae archaeon A-CW2]
MGKKGGYGGGKAGCRLEQSKRFIPVRVTVLSDDTTDELVEPGAGCLRLER